MAPIASWSKAGHLHEIRILGPFQARFAYGKAEICENHEKAEINAGEIPLLRQATRIVARGDTPRIPFSASG
jgi:hypothetical protein